MSRFRRRMMMGAAVVTGGGGVYSKEELLTVAPNGYYMLSYEDGRFHPVSRSIDLETGAYLPVLFIRDDATAATPLGVVGVILATQQLPWNDMGLYDSLAPNMSDYNQDLNNPVFGGRSCAATLRGAGDVSVFDIVLSLGEIIGEEMEYAGCSADVQGFLGSPREIEHLAINHGEVIDDFLYQTIGGYFTGTYQWTCYEYDATYAWACFPSYTDVAHKAEFFDVLPLIALRY